MGQEWSNLFWLGGSLGLRCTVERSAWTETILNFAILVFLMHVFRGLYGVT